MDDRQLHAHLIGQQGSRAALNTPVLVLDLDALDRNIAAMAALTAAQGVGLRPHAKTHKSVDIARRQVAAGALGACCAKIGEAEVLAEGGVGGLLITSPVAAPAAIMRLAALAKASPGLMAVVDDPAVVAMTERALADADARLDVVIDVDPGIHRTGVASPDAAVALAQAVAAAPHLRWRGVQFYCGAQQHIENYAERRAAIEERTGYLQTVLAALAEAGFAAEIVTGSGTGSHRIDLELGVFTELQAGSYVFMDRQYLDCDLGDGGRRAAVRDVADGRRAGGQRQPRCAGHDRRRVQVAVDRRRRGVGAARRAGRHALRLHGRRACRADRARPSWAFAGW